MTELAVSMPATKNWFVSGAYALRLSPRMTIVPPPAYDTAMRPGRSTDSVPLVVNVESASVQ